MDQLIVRKIIEGDVYGGSWLLDETLVISGLNFFRYADKLHGQPWIIKSTFMHVH